MKALEGGLDAGASHVPEAVTSPAAASLAGKKILLVSRCAWTLFNFRRGLIETLLDHGCRVVAGGAGDDGFAPEVEALGARFVPLPVDRRGTSLSGDVRLLWKLYLWYRRERPDIVHHFTIKPVIYGSIAARLAGVPRIVNTVTGLGHVFLQDKSWLRRLVAVLYRLAFSCAHQTFFQNPDDQRLFIEQGLIKEVKARLVPGSGVDLRHFRPPDVRRTRDDGVCRFLFMGRLLREKGIYEFVAAARDVKARYPSAEFVILGRRDERNPSVVPVQQIQQWQSEGVVEWRGEATDVRATLGAADVVVLPSYREGTPRSLLEAAAMGKPVITTDTPGCREAAEHDRTGVLIPAGDSGALAEAMARLLEDSDRRHRMGNAGREKVAREFDERTVIGILLECYNEAPPRF